MINSLFCRVIASRWRPSSSFDVPTSQPTGMFLERARRRPLKSPRTLRYFPCTWTPFCFRWPSWWIRVGVRWPICTRWRHPWELQRSYPCHRRCWLVRRWFPWSILSFRQRVRRCILSWSGNEEIKNVNEMILWHNRSDRKWRHILQQFQWNFTSNISWQNPWKFPAIIYESSRKDFALLR